MPEREVDIYLSFSVNLFYAFDNIVMDDFKYDCYLNIPLK